MYVFTKPICTMWHKVNFKQTLTDLSAEFFYLTGTNFKEPSLPYYLLIGGVG